MVKKREAAVEMFSSPEFKEIQKKAPKAKKKLKRFSKVQLEAINNSPMFVKKREQAEAFFSSPGYKKIQKKASKKRKDLRKEMTSSRIDIIFKLREQPLRLSDLIRIAAKLGMDQNKMSLLADVSIRTFKMKPKSSLLSFHISERVLMLENLYQIGLDVFDSNESPFQDWLKSRIPALDNHVPNDLLTSLLGIDVVKEELLRIEHGVY